jgi:hypothetical protein
MKLFPDSIDEDYVLKAVEGSQWQCRDGRSRFTVLEIFWRGDDIVWGTTALIDRGYAKEVVYLSVLEHQCGWLWTQVE